MVQLVLEHPVYRDTPVFAVFLDASKAFDKVIMIFYLKS